MRRTIDEKEACARENLEELDTLVRRSIHESECKQPSQCDSQKKADTLQKAEDRFTKDSKKPRKCSLFCCWSSTHAEENRPLLKTPSVNGK